MKKMKRFLAIALTLAMVLSLAACGGSKKEEATTSGSEQTQETTEASGTSISLWTYPIGGWGDEKAVKELTDAFEAETGIHVEVTATPGNDDDHDAKVNIDLMAGNPIDVIESVGPKNYTIRNEGKFFMPLKDLVARAGVDANALWGSNLPADQSGEYYGIPFKQELWCVYYNKDMFDAAGVEYPKVGWTWDEYVAIAKKLSDPKKGIFHAA